MVEGVLTRMGRRARAGRAGALMVLDCDRFKAVNDRQGHAVGDRVLRRVAEILSTSIREVDTPARLGGASSRCS